MSHGHKWRGILVQLGFLLLTASVVGHRDEPDPTEDQNLTREEELRRDLVKLQILQKLGLSEKPAVDLAHKISKDLVLETLQRASGGDGNGTAEPTLSPPANFSTGFSEEEALSNNAKTSEIISFPDKGPVLNGHNLLSFSYAGNHAYGMGVRIKKAFIWVKMDYRSSIGRHFGHLLQPRGIILYVFQAHGNFSQSQEKLKRLHLNSQDVSLELVMSKSLSLESLGWQKLDVTSVVQKWYGKISRHRVRHQSHHSHHLNHQKLTLLVDCSGCGYSIRPLNFSPEAPDTDRSNSIPDDKKNEEGNKEEDLTEMPFLVLETESSPNFKRSRRRALECSPRVKHCCKQRFYVSFKDLGWDDWIIAPRGYYANYCRGHCGGLHRTPDTFLNYHTHVIEEYRRTHGGNLTGIIPCCAPTKFSSMSLIYFGPDLNIIKRDLPKMIVEECGCP